MLEFHPDVETPESSTAIWRYMAVDRLRDLLAASSLWFSRCDFFKDGWEGRYSDATFGKFLKSFVGPEEGIQKLWRTHQDVNHETRRCLYVNCWHIGEEESVALWETYLNSGKCVAVKSTVHKLRDALAGTESTIYAGRVKYCDYATEAMPIGNFFTPFLRKRRTFSFENELRLLYWRSDLMLQANKPDVEFPPGTPVPLNLTSFIEAIHISPNGDSHIRDAIADLLQEFDLKRVKIVQSNLFTAPS